MAKSFPSVNVSRVTNSGDLIPKYDFDVNLVIDYDPQGLSVKLKKDDNKNEELSEFPVHRFTECSRVGALSYIFTFDSDSLCLKFSSEADLKRFHSYVKEVKIGKNQSVFSERTDDSSAVQYFKFYGYLSQQQNMLQDFVRTSTYQKAVLVNSDDFKDKVVLDVGAGSGILSFFAVQAGAKRVYAVEASSMALHAETLVNANNMRDKINVIAGKIEEVVLPEMVDVIISEPMGYMLFNERMLETYLHAKKWLKSGGIMFPSRGDLHIAPFNDESLFMEQTNKANFWVQTCFHGVDLSSMRGAAMKEYFSHPIVDTFDMRICMAKSIKHSVDFGEAQEEDLRDINIPLEFYILESGMVHGLALWFDVAFTGSNQTVWLSTSPTEPLTHWYQVRCLLEKPIFAKHGQRLTGKIVLQANQRQSYDVTMELCIEGADNTKVTNTLDLQNPYFRYTGQPVAPPPGVSTTSPSESYWNQLDTQGARQAVNMVNGITVNGLGDVSMDTLQNNAGIINLGVPDFYDYEEFILQLSLDEIENFE
ncbi:histone-arginine methyltransferase CARMER isoform X1 [Nilaparvata lugens]|uniref:histone-arginine methyltransferase CARMER isoform X1 n=1 Tax=Nilaparvata lugens TaxID=108931 RepID=UPI000B99C52C|nr:histone-arginine methyltransferase CARMER isoform X1 [Nilaparvata lugens]